MDRASDAGHVLTMRMWPLVLFCTSSSCVVDHPAPAHGAEDAPEGEGEDAVDGAGEGSGFEGDGDVDEPGVPDDPADPDDASGDGPDDVPDDVPDEVGDGPADDLCGEAVDIGDWSGCSLDANGDQRCVLSHGGRERAFIVHVPENLQTPASVVLSFHGLRTTASLQRWVSHMNDNSDAGGFVVVYPEGIGMSWNAGACCGEATSSNLDDVGFSVAVVDWLGEHLCIARDRVFATGLSNGGHMAYKLACDRADVFAAVASVAGVVATACAPTRPVPVLHFHGTADSIVNYDVGISGVGAEETVARWRERNGCSATSTVTFEQGDVTCRAFDGCRDNATVELCSVQGGGHQWPGGSTIPLLGTNTNDVVASDRIAAFFAAHPMP